MFTIFKVLFVLAYISVVIFIHVMEAADPNYKAYSTHILG